MQEDSLLKDVCECRGSLSKTINKIDSEAGVDTNRNVSERKTDANSTGESEKRTAAENGQEHSGEPALSPSLETLNSNDEVYASSDAEVSGGFGPGRLYLHTTNVNVINTVRHFSWSLRSTVRTRSSNHRHQPIDEENALALLNKPCSNYSTKCSELLKFISKNPQTADFKISLYMVASEAVSLLKPFPKSVVEETNNGVLALTLINEEVPSTQLLQLYLKDPKQFRISDSVVSLLHWLLVYQSDPKIMRLPPECFYSIFQKVANGKNYQEPTHVFKLMTSSSSVTECKWRALKEGKKSRFAFYGDCFKVMHSIIHLGFYPLIHADGLHGPGVYLYTDLQHCLDMTDDEGWSWGKSELGGQMKVVLVVEILEDEDCRVYNEYITVASEQKALTIGDMEQELHCLFVPRAELVRIRYVLLFVKRASRVCQAVIPVKTKRTVGHWLSEKKKICIVFGSLLALAGAARFVYGIKTPRSDFIMTKLPLSTSPVSTL